MRILFTFVGGHGHFRPLVPIARSAVDAGHTVAVAGGGRMTPVIEAAGFTAVATGPAGTAPSRRLPLRPPDSRRDDRELREHFGRAGARRHASAVFELGRAWKPDVIVCDEVDFGSMLAAERLGIPYASVLVLAAGSFLRPEVVAESLHELRSELGLPPDPDLTMLSRYLVVSPGPPRFRHPEFPLPDTAFSIRPGDVSVRTSAPSDVPTVYFTLGTEFNTESGDLFSRVLAGLHALPVTAVVTVGDDIDPAELGPQPQHVRVHRYVPQAEILPGCDLMVSHGGSGSVLGALAHGVPLVLLPLGADQAHTAARCAALGAGRVLDPVAVTAEGVRAEVSAVLAQPGYRRAAEVLRREVAELPGPGSVVPLLERLVG